MIYEKTQCSEETVAHTGAKEERVTLLAADVPYQSILAIFGRVVNEDKCASTASSTVDSILRPQREKHGGRNTRVL